MTRAFGRWVLLVVVASVLVSGCGGANPPAEVKLDPSLADKPFPKVPKPSKP